MKRANITRRDFATLAAALSVATLSACGGKGGSDEKPAADEKPDAPEASYAPYWVTEKIELDGEEWVPDGLVERTEDFVALALNPDGMGVICTMGQSIPITWEDDGDVVTLDIMGEKYELPHEGDTLLLTMDEGGSEMLVTLVNVDEMPACIADSYDPLLFFMPELSVDDTCAMSNVMIGNILTVEGNTFYGVNFDPDSGHRGLYAMEFEETDGGIEVKDPVCLDADCAPQHVTCKDGYLYYLRFERGADTSTICRIPLEGGDPEVLRDAHADYLHMRGDHLYFTDEDYRYVMTDLDGGNLEVILDKEVYYPYPVDDDWIIYQDDADGETLHLFHRPDDADVRVADGRCMCPIICDRTLWFTRDYGDYDDYRLVKMDLTSYDPEARAYACEESPLPCSSEIAIDGTWIYLESRPYGAAVQQVEIEDWDQLELEESDSEYTTVESYVSRDYNAECDVYVDGSTSNIRGHRIDPWEIIGLH